MVPPDEWSKSMRRPLAYGLSAAATTLASGARAQDMGGMSGGGMSCVVAQPQAVGGVFGTWDQDQSGGFGIASSVAPIPAKVVLTTFSLGASYVHTSTVFGAQPPYLANSRLYEIDPMITVAAGATDWLSFTATLPLRSSIVRVDHTDLAGNAYQPPTPDTFNRDENVLGLADPTLLAVLGSRFGRYGFSVPLGAMLPLGRTLAEDPNEAGRQGRVHDDIQYGAGTVRPVVGSAVGYDVSASLGLDAWFVAIPSFAPNSAGYRAGNQIATGARARSRLGTRDWLFGIGAEFDHQSTETWNRVQESAGNLGRDDAFGVATVQWFPAPSWALFGVVRATVFSHVIGMDQKSPGTLQFGVAKMFDFRDRPNKVAPGPGGSS